jgi:hypothetical protein
MKKRTIFQFFPFSQPVLEEGLPLPACSKQVDISHLLLAQTLTTQPVMAQSEMCTHV